ncbi:MAG: translation initiation factor IF-1 [Candidatus Paceibacterota bacterium]|jgi:translation initiation factor IF-1
MPKKDDTIKKEGTIEESLPNGFFKVKLEDGSEVLAHLAGKLRVFKIRILPGDSVTVEMTPYDDKRGRIVYRKK